MKHKCPDRCHRCPDGHLYVGCEGHASAGMHACTCKSRNPVLYRSPPEPAPPADCPDRCHYCNHGGEPTVYIGCIGVAAGVYARYCTCTPPLSARYDPPETEPP